MYYLILFAWKKYIKLVLLYPLLCNEEIETHVKARVIFWVLSFLNPNRMATEYKMQNIVLRHIKISTSVELSLDRC